MSPLNSATGLPLLMKNGMAVFISQSGETADTLAALKYAREHQQTTLAVVNVAASSIAREADMSVQTQAGPEIGVASTKAFTAQLSVLASLVIQAAEQREGISADMAKAAFTTLARVPGQLEEVLDTEHKLCAIGESLESATDAYFIGRGSSFPIAMEGALKLKEISYIHAEGFGAGELKHGPIALIEPVCRCLSSPLIMTCWKNPFQHAGSRRPGWPLHSAGR